jgi:hypothetical protein
MVYNHSDVSYRKTLEGVVIGSVFYHRSPDLSATNPFPPGFVFYRFELKELINNL